MNLGLCVVAYGGTVFNVNTTEKQALYFETADQLLEHLENLTPELREETGRKMKELAQIMYTWKAISRAYSNTLEGALGNPVAFQDELNKEKVLTSIS